MSEIPMNQNEMESRSNILIVDDDLNNLRMISLCLKDTGHKILVAQDGASALDKAKFAQLDLILMDVVMPNMDGFETCLRLKEMKAVKDVPIIFMTSLSDMKNKVKGFQVGGVDYLTKPIQFEEVLARVSTHLRIQENKKLLEYQKRELEIKSEEEAASNEELIALNEELIALNEEMTAVNEEMNAVNEELKDTNEKLTNENNERKNAEKALDQSNLELIDTISELKSMQTYLIQAEKMVALGNLVAGLAHEINTPIGIGVTAASNLKQLTDGFVHLVEEKPEEKDSVKEYINDIQLSSDIILKNLERAGRLIQNFKLVSTDQSHMEKRTFNLKTYTDEVLLSLKPMTKKTNINILLECDHIEIKSYPGSFSQIISNLVVNALMHAFDEEDLGTISIDIRKIERLLKIVFTDDGKGMTEEVKNKIFDPFFTTKRASGGTGLGMYVVYNIVVQQLGGKIECTSELGKGTTFQLQFTT